MILGDSQNREQFPVWKFNVFNGNIIRLSICSGVKGAQENEQTCKER
jgi:hypothetical protein